MKAIIPVAGAGTKLRPHTYTQHKALIPLAGKPILGYVIDQLKVAGVVDYVFIIGHLGDKIQNFVNENYPDIHAEFITQSERKGTAHAIGLTKEAVGNDKELVIVYGDTIVEIDLGEILARKGNQIGIGKVEDPSGFGIVELDTETGDILRFVEKPKIPKSNLALIGVYKISEREKMFDAIEKTAEKEEGGERSFTMVLNEMNSSGSEFHSFRVERWYDCGKKENILDTNKLMLQKLKDQDQLPNHEIPNSIIFQPTIIGKNCYIENSIIGPYTSIGDNVKVVNSIIDGSIVGAYSELEKIVLNNSLIGNDVVVKGNNHELNIGDNTEIDMS